MALRRTARAANSVSDSAGAGEQTEANNIEWTDCADVFAPSVVEARAWTASLGLARVPPILPHQTYIFVRRAAMQKVQAHLAANVRVEQGGLLVGQACIDPALGTHLLLVNDALCAPDGVETATFFGYTAATWTTLTPLLTALPHDCTVLGSYHSHPDMGVFLSETDLNTQADVFAADWQLALVVDPVRAELGFFVGAEGRPCGDWYVVA